MTLFNEQLNKLLNVTLPERQQIRDQREDDENIQVVDQSAKSQDFFQDNNPPGKKYTTARTKTRNFSFSIFSIFAFFFL